METLENGQTKITFQNEEMLFDEATFAPVKKFVENICYMVEYAKLQYNNMGRNLYINHMASMENIEAEYKPKMLAMLAAGLENVIFCG